jgi:PAS domain S-box-containing protein
VGSTETRQNRTGMFTVYATPPAQTAAVAERWPLLVHIMLGRLLVLGGMFLAGSAFLAKFEFGFYAFCAFAFMVTIPYAMWLNTPTGVRRCTYVQFFVDALVTTGIVHYTGGIQSQLFFIYPLIILGAGVVVSGSFALRITIFCVALYAAEIVLEAHGILHFRGHMPLPYMEMDAVMQNLMLRIFVFVIYSAASSYLADFCSWQGRQIHRYTALVNTIFDRMSVGLFAVSTDDKIVLVNQSAAKILGQNVEAMIGQSFRNYFEKPEKISLSTSPEKNPARVIMKRPDGETIPVVCETSTAVLPPALTQGHTFRELFKGAIGRDEDINVYIVAVQDISLQLENQRSAEELCRLTTTVRVVTELAHHVRNTVTSFLCAVDLVERIMQDISLKEKPAPSDLSDVKNMHRIVTTQVDELEKEVQLFLDSAAENPAELANEASEAYERYFGNA